MQIINLHLTYRSFKSPYQMKERIKNVTNKNKNAGIYIITLSENLLLCQAHYFTRSIFLM